MQERKSAFISYSWDSISHQQWVQKLVNKLRQDGGVIATFDRFETQRGTTHLPKMMIEKVRESDYTIIVLTKKYAEKADNFLGGVGFENMSFLSLLQENKDKLIFIKRDSVDFNEVVPFHFKGYYIIDFSNDEEFEVGFEELLHRIYNVPLFEEAPLGDIPELKPKKIFNNNQNQHAVVEVFSENILRLNKSVTDLDKDIYLKKSYNEIKLLFTQLFKQLTSSDPSFVYQLEDISSYKSVYKFYRNGYEITGLKMWIGSQFGRGINFSYGTMIDPFQDNSMNESALCEVDSQNNLSLKLLSGSNVNSPKEVVEEIWKHSLKHHFK